MCTTSRGPRRRHDGEQWSQPLALPGEARERCQVGMMRAEAWDLMSLVSPLVSQLLLSLVAAGPDLGTGFASSHTPVLILCHPHAGGAVASISSPIAVCVFRLHSVLH